MGTRTLLIIAAIIVALMVVLPKPQTVVSDSWDIDLEGKEMYLMEENDIDFTPELAEIANEIKQSSNNPDQAVRKTIDYVYKNIQYSGSVSVPYCYLEKSSTVLNSGVGDCVSMSRLTTSLLRLQGIPARTVGGCVSSLTPCSPLFAISPIPLQAVEITEGDFKKRGFLHEWVEAYTPNQGWVLLETTAGRILDTDCPAYIQYAYDTNNINRCTITDRDFWSECRGA